MVQDIMSCVRELTDQENSYAQQANLHMKFSQTFKHQDLEEYDSFFVEKDIKAAYASSYSNSEYAGLPPYKQHNSILK